MHKVMYQFRLKLTCGFGLGQVLRKPYSRGPSSRRARRSRVPVDHSPYTCLLFSNEDKEKEREERRYEILLLSTKWPTNRHVLCCAC